MNHNKINAQLQNWDAFKYFQNLGETMGLVGSPVHNACFWEFLSKNYLTQISILVVSRSEQSKKNTDTFLCQF